MSTHSAPSLLVEHLERARAARFVGRGPELAHVAAMLADPDPPRALYVYGPGGIGKTELLREAGRRARAAGRAVVELDRDRPLEPPDLELAPPVEPAPVEAALGTTLTDAEISAIVGALERNHGNRTHAAAELGVSRRTLQKKMARLGIR